MGCLPHGRWPASLTVETAREGGADTCYHVRSDQHQRAHIGHPHARHCSGQQEHDPKHHNGKSREKVGRMQSCERSGMCSSLSERVHLPAHSERCGSRFARITQVQSRRFYLTSRSQHLLTLLFALLCPVALASAVAFSPNVSMSLATLRRGLLACLQAPSTPCKDSWLVEHVSDLESRQIGR
jgi:hypothetical protein